jgi:hypothetical protein
VQAWDVQAYDVQAYDVQAYDVQAYDVQAHELSRRGPIFGSAHGAVVCLEAIWFPDENYLEARVAKRLRRKVGK